MFRGQLFCLFLNNNSFLSDGSSLYHQVVVFKTIPLGEEACVLVTYPAPARTSSCAHTHCHLSGRLAMGRFSALLGLPACPSPGHLASARFLELPASVRTSPYYSSPYLLSGSGLTFPAWASSYSTSCQMPRMYLLLAMLPLAHIESSVTSHYHAVATSSLYESSSNSGAPPHMNTPK